MTDSPRRRHRSPQRLVRRRVFGLPLVVALLGLPTGCDNGAPLRLGGLPVLSADAVSAAQRIHHEEEGNDSFETPDVLELSPDETVEIRGDITTPQDIDVLKITTLRDEEILTVLPQLDEGSKLRIALFDRTGMRLGSHTARGGSLSKLTSHYQFKLHDRALPVYVCVAAAHAEAHQTGVSRKPIAYSLILNRTTTPAEDAKPAQVVWLNFEGGVPNKFAWAAAGGVAPFSAERIGQHLAGETSYIIDAVLDHLVEDFREFNIVFLCSHRHEPPLEPHSTIFFGGSHESYLGMAEDHDDQNRVLDQEAIVFTENLHRLTQLNLSADEVAQYLANIAAHELGHLLGLAHTEGATGLMRIWPSVQAASRNEAGFETARLAPEVFPIGWQNGKAYLRMALGPA